MARHLVFVRWEGRGFELVLHCLARMNVAHFLRRPPVDVMTGNDILPRPYRYSASRRWRWRWRLHMYHRFGILAAGSDMLRGGSSLSCGSLACYRAQGWCVSLLWAARGAGVFSGWGGAKQVSQNNAGRAISDQAVSKRTAHAEHDNIHQHHYM